MTYVPIDGDADVLPGIRILSTPGHSPGHQSLLVDTRGVEGMQPTHRLVVPGVARGRPALATRTSLPLVTRVDRLARDQHRSAAGRDEQRLVAGRVARAGEILMPGSTSRSPSIGS